jgi:hypothetical protein
LLDGAALGGAKLVLAGFVGGGNFGVAEIDRCRDVLRLDLEQHERAIGGRGEKLRVLVVERLEIGFGGRGQFRLVRLQDKVPHVALFAGLAHDGLHKRLRRVELAYNGIGKRLAHLARLLLKQEHLLVEAVLLKNLPKAGGVEPALRILKRGIGGDLVGDHRVGNSKVHLAGLLLQGAVAQHLTEDLPVEPQFLGPLIGYRLTRLARDNTKPLLERPAERLGRYLIVAHRRQNVGTIAREYVIDAPNGKTQSKKTNENLRHPSGGSASQTFHHGNKFLVRANLRFLIAAHHR